MKKLIFSLILLSSFVSNAQSLNNDLLDACYENDEIKIFDLLRKGADPNAKTINNVTPLMYAVQNGNYFISQKLIDAGAEVDAKPNNGIYPIFNALFNQDTAIFLLLLENGSDPNLTYNYNMKSLLMTSINRINYFFAEALLEYGADPNMPVKQVTPLTEAIYLGVDTSFINLLLKYEADPNLKNKNGYSPLMIAVLYENIEATKILIKNGAKPSTKRDKSLSTEDNVLDYAIYYQLDEFVDLYAPYFVNDLKYYHTKAILSDYNSGARKIRKKTGKLFLTPILSHAIITGSLNFNYSDIFGGFKIGFSEARYKIDFKFGIEPRFFRKPVLIQYRPNYLLQLRETRTLVFGQIQKNIVLKSDSKSTTGLFLGAKAVLSFGDYSGFEMDITYPFEISPLGGIYFKQGIFKMNIAYSYLPIETNFPHYLGFDFDFLIPFHIEI